MDQMGANLDGIRSAHEMSAKRLSLHTVRTDLWAARQLAATSRNKLFGDCKHAHQSGRAPTGMLLFTS